MTILKQQLPPLLKLALPAVGAQLGMMAMGTVDTIMAGQISVTALAASAIANAWLLALLWSGQGLIQGIDPLISQAHGAGRQDHALLALHRGEVLAVFLCVPIIIGIFLTEDILLLFKQDAELAALALNYLEVQIWSVLPFFLFVALRQYLQGREIVKPMLWVALIANVFNVAGNYALIYGHWGFPALGLEGAGMASGLTRTFMFIGLLMWVLKYRLIAGSFLPFYRQVYCLKEFRVIVLLGLPIAVQVGLEILAFSSGTFIAGILGETPLAAHTVALTIASVAFMVPLGISQGAATRVGNLIGAHQYQQAKHAGWVAIGTGGVVMLFAALVFVLLRSQLPIFFTSNQDVIIIAAMILPIAATFQVFDGLQVVCSGVLRGMGRPLPSAIANLFAFWVIGLPLGYWLAIEQGYGLSGLWWSLSLGLALVAISLSLWIAFRGPEKHAQKFE